MTDRKERRPFPSPLKLGSTLDAILWVVINNGNYQVFTDLEDAKKCDGTIVTAPLDPPIVNTYKVTAHMYSSIIWVACIYGKAGGWAKHGDVHGVVAYHWHVQATSRDEAIAKAKQLFRDSI